MRVIAGEFRGRTLRGPRSKVPGARPTSDRVKTVIFDTLGPLDSGVAVCDLFAGSGGLGIEALSRGALRATFVESDRRTLECVRENIDALGLDARATLVRRDAFAFLKASERNAWLLILVDPPYDARVGDDLLALVAEREAIAPGGRLVIEHSADESVGESAGDLLLLKRKKLGQTTLSIYERRPR